MLCFHTIRQTRAIEHTATQETNLPGLLLMKRAGLFAFDCLQRNFNDPKTIAVLCGTGHNGGDGFVVAQLALLAGLKVNLMLHGSPDTLHGDALTIYQELLALGVSTSLYSKSLINQADVVVDALFGIGLNRPIIGPLAEQIEWLNRQNKPVLSLDVPSGLNADTGAILGVAIRATYTCTFITRKLGLHTFSGSETAGNVLYSPLFIVAKKLQDPAPIAFNHPLQSWIKKLPPRRASDHKGTSGSVCLIGGHRAMMGAIQLAGLASLKMGAGLVKIVTHPEHTVAITQSIPELMCSPPDALASLLPHAEVVAIGPGLGLDDWSQNLYQQAVTSALPKVVDADALKLLAQTPQKQSNWVLTPHPGEAALLLDTTIANIQSDRVKAIKTLQQKYGGVIVLKGSGSLIYDGERLEICLAGNAGMAVGGMGDILTGAVAGFIAQGLSLWDATCLGVSLHAHAGDLLAQQKGQFGILPSELAFSMNQLLHSQPTVADE